jgi:hypothetical protein
VGVGESTDHDQLLKTVIREFFPDHRLAVFPEPAAE